MNVIDMPQQVLLVANGVFPEPPGPKCALVRFSGVKRYSAIPEAPCEAGFDQTPSCRIIGFVFRKSPECMQMVWQYDYRDRVERMASSCFTHRGAQGGDMPCQHVRATVLQGEREEIHAARLAVATIGDHALQLGLAMPAPPSAVSRHSCRKSPTPRPRVSRLWRSTRATNLQLSKRRRAPRRPSW